MELFCEIIRHKLCHWPRQRVWLQTCVNFSLGAKRMGWHLLVHAQVDAEIFLTQVRTRIS